MSEKMRIKKIIGSQEKAGLFGTQKNRSASYAPVYRWIRLSPVIFLL